MSYELEFWDSTWASCEDVLGLLSTQPSAGHPDVVAVRNLLARLNDLAQAVDLLEREMLEARKDHALSGMCLVRSAYDAHLQLLWILHSPVDRRARGLDWIDFQWIDTLRQRFMVLDSKATFQQRLAARVAANPARQSAAAAQDAHIIKIGARFLTPKGERELSRRGTGYLLDREARYRMHWYQGSLSSLAQACGYMDEYQLFIESGGHQAVHSSASAVLNGAVLQMAGQKLMCARFAMRCAHRIAESFSLPLNPFNATILAHAQAPATNWIIDRNGLRPDSSADASGTS